MSIAENNRTMKIVLSRRIATLREDALEIKLAIQKAQWDEMEDSFELFAQFQATVFEITALKSYLNFLSGENSEKVMEIIRIPVRRTSLLAFERLSEALATETAEVA